MKQIINKDDALYNSMIWNFDRIKFDAKLKKVNLSNNNLHIKYLVSNLIMKILLIILLLLIINNNIII